MVQQILSTNTFTTAKWIVSATASDGTHTTVQAAITSASSGDTIFIRPGTYTENLTLKVGVNLTAFGSDSSFDATGKVIIAGTCTLTTGGTVTISGVQLQTNGAALLEITGVAASIVNLDNCYLNCTNASGITFSSSSASAKLNIFSCNGNLGTTGITYFTKSGPGTIASRNTLFLNSGASITASTVSAGQLNYQSCTISFPHTTSSTGAVVGYYSIVHQPGNTTCLTTGGTSESGFFNSQLYSGSASAVSIGSGSACALFDCEVSSSNTNAVTGLGSLAYYSVSLTGTSNVINTTTLNASYVNHGKYKATGQPSFNYYTSSSTANVTGDSTNYTIIWNTKLFEQGSNFNTGTGVFTAPVDGIYLFNAAVTISGIGAAHTKGQLFLTTTPIASIVLGSYSPSACRSNDGYLQYTGSFIVNLTATNTVSVSVRIDNGTKVVGVLSGNINTYFSGYLVC